MVVIRFATSRLRSGGAAEKIVTRSRQRTRHSQVKNKILAKYLEARVNSITRCVNWASSVLFACHVVAGSVDAPVIADGRLVSWPYADEGVAVIPPGVKRIEEMAFADRRIEGVEFPESLESVGAYAFWRCRKLREVRLPQSVKDVGDNVFEDCSSLTNAIVLAKIKSTSSAMFSKCRQLCRVVLPEGLNGIGDFSFAGCRALREIRIPTAVTCIGRCAFCGCSRLQKLVSSGKLEKIGNGAFGGCYDLCDFSVSYTHDVAVTNVRDNVTCQQVGVSNGLTSALRMAADGFASKNAFDSVNVGQIDAFAAEAWRMDVGVDWKDLWGSVWNPKSRPSEKEDERNAVLKDKRLVGIDFGLFNGDIVGLELAIADGKILGISFTKALKEGSRMGLKASGAVADEKILRWLR